MAPWWRQLAEDSPYTSFFLGADWTGAWLEVFGELLQTEILIFEGHGEVVGACLLVKRVEPRGPFRVRRVYLHTGGENAADKSSVEFNNLLCCLGWEQEVAATLGVHLSTLLWDEFTVPGLSPVPTLRWLETEAFPGLVTSCSLRPSYYVNLARLRESNTPYESTLSANTRQQLRRSLKLYARRGAVRIEAARDLPEAQCMFDELTELHQRAWRARGLPGAFVSGRKVAFHRSLIRRAFPRGSVQLLRVLAGEEIIGLLYNFVEKGKVYFYQGGLNYGEDKRLKPGLVAHTSAIRYCIEQGLDDYDFLAGDARYKRSLAKDARLLVWVVFSRPHLKLALIELLRAMKRRVRDSVRDQTRNDSSDSLLGN